MLHSLEEHLDQVEIPGMDKQKGVTKPGMWVFSVAQVVEQVNSHSIFGIVLYFKVYKL